MVKENTSSHGSLSREVVLGEVDKRHHRYDKCENYTEEVVYPHSVSGCDTWRVALASRGQVLRGVSVRKHLLSAISTHSYGRGMSTLTPVDEKGVYVISYTIA